MTATINQATLATYRADLTPAYIDYCQTVSKRTMAISLETAAWILSECHRRRPVRVCDLGSGFTSYVLRCWQRDAGFPVEVVSVDDDPEWLARTGDFLERYAKPFARLADWDTWLYEDDRYDLIVHDFASGGLRESSMWVAAARLNRGGTIIFDDAQHRSHRQVMADVAEVRGWTVTDLAVFTFDAVHRFAAQIVDSPTVADRYVELCNTQSDIYLHLPTLVEIVETLEAVHVIELGTRSGVSTVAFLHALTGTQGRLTSVDLDAPPDIGAHDHWSFIQGDDLDPTVIAQLDPADVVFIDTSHLYEQTIQELYTYRWLVKPGGVIVCHDTELAQPEGAPGWPRYPVKRAVEEFTADCGFDWINHPDCWGLAVIRTGG